MCLLLYYEGKAGQAPDVALDPNSCLQCQIGFFHTVELLHTHLLPIMYLNAELQG